MSFIQQTTRQKKHEFNSPQSAANIHFTEYKQKYFAKSNKIDNFAHGKPNVQKQSRGRESRCPYLRQDKN